MAKIEVEKAASMLGHKDCVYTLEKTDKNNIFFSAGGDGMVVQWDMEKPDIGELIAKVPNSIYALSFIPSKNQLLLGQNFQGLHLIDLLSRREINSAAITTSYIFDIKINEDLVYVGTGDGKLIVLSLFDLSLIGKFQLSNKSVRCMAIHAERDLLALGLSDHSIRIFSLKKNQQIQHIIDHQNSIFTLAFSPDGKNLISGSRDAHIKIWDCENNFALKKSIVAHMYAVNHIEFSPEADLFASCSMDKSIKIWDAQKFELLKIIDKSRHSGHGTSVNKLLWTTYKNQIVSCSDDRSISTWNLTFKNPEQR